MTLTQKKRLIIAALVLCVAAGFVGLVSLALKENLQLYYTPGDIAQHLAPLDRTIRLGGMVVPGSVHHDKHSMQVNFTLTDGADTVDVQYVGVLPDLFKEGQGIVALGVLKDSHLLIAQEVLAKHDENYMPRPLKQREPRP